MNSKLKKMIEKRDAGTRGAELLKTERLKKTGDPAEYTKWLNSLSDSDWSLLVIETTKNKPGVKHVFINL